LKDEARKQKDALEASEELNRKLTEEMAEMTRSLAIAKKKASKNAQKTHLAESKDEDNAALEEALREAKEENEKRVRDTNQFMTMKKLMQGQAHQIRDLRKRLEAYESHDEADYKSED